MNQQDVPNELALRQLVNRSKIFWERWPGSVPTGSGIEQTGYSLELLGTYAEGVQDAAPGSAASMEVYRAFRKIVVSILPQENNLPTRYEIQPFAPELRYSAVPGTRPSGHAGLKILHRDGLGPVDDREKRCLKFMQDRLAELGMKRGCWARSTDSPSESIGRTAA